MTVDYQQRITTLLDQCQKSWVSLQTTDTDNTQDQVADDAKIQELHNGIKRLVQLQDELDANETIAKNLDWQRKTDSLLEQTWQQLQDATRGTQMEKSPYTFTVQSMPFLISSLSTSSTRQIHSDTSSQSSRRSLVTMSMHDDEKDKHTTSIFNQPRVSGSIFDQSRNPAVDDYVLITQQPHDISYKDDTQLSKNLTKFTPISKGTMDKGHERDNEMQQQDQLKFGRRSVMMGSLSDIAGNSLDNRSPLRILPIFKGLHSTQSTPLPGSPVHINFYRDDEENANRRKEIFATDAIVSNPIRIGVGYGSYICYSCTVLSDKGPSISVRKRYSEFVDLRDELVKSYPRLKGSIPKLPPKKVVGKFIPSFVEQRRRDLEYFFKYVVLHPTLGRSPIVTHWIAP